MSPRFSILLPTRNGGNFIADCIHSVLSQNFGSFELVVSDNNNTDETADVLARIRDPRVKAVRQAVTLPVHENWNASLEAASGEYFLMLGDDDYLMPGALARLDTVISSYADPDCVLINGYSYVAPKSVNDAAISYWSPQHFHYDSNFTTGAVPFAQRMAIVRDMFRFRQRIPLNMQTTVFARKSLKKLAPPIFRPPFPDHYLLNALLIAANSWTYVPERLVVVGVSPKSFGHFFYGQDSSAGLEYLGIETRAPGLVPGNELLNGMYQWLALLLRNFPHELSDVAIDRSAYLVRQLRFWLIQYRHGGLSTAQLRQRLALLSAKDWRHLSMAAFDTAVWARAKELLRPRHRDQALALWAGLQPLEGIPTIRAFADWVTAKP